MSSSKALKRPNAKETEEDLLKQQEEFLKEKYKEKEKEATKRLHSPPSSSSSSAATSSSNFPAPFSLIGDIVEKRCPSAKIVESMPALQEDGFPAMFLVDTNEVPSKKAKKKSLFAIKLEQGRMKNQVEAAGTKMEVETFPEVFKEKDVYDENVKALENMSVEEILEEKKKLEATMDPNLLSFLKSRGAKKKVESSPSPQVKKEGNLVDVKQSLLQTVDKDWLEIDKIEPEKLQWIGDIPDATALEPDKPYSARFDFQGDLQPFKTEIDVRTSLHHHGEDPARPGYTIQELYQLSRSSVLQQRILALNTLANIIRKTKMGYYDSCFDGALLKTLVESEVFFLLRFAMDDRSITAAAVNCLHELFVNRSDEVCLDRLRFFPGEDKEPFLLVSVELDKDTEEADLKDEVIISQDLIKGVLRTDLIVRFIHLLNNFDLDSLTIGRIFDVVVRVCRHSPEACESVRKEEDLMVFVFRNLNGSEPCVEGVKLLRVLASSSRSIAESLLKDFDFGFIFKILDLDSPVFKLKLECLALWKELISNGLLIDKLESFSPCLVRLLWFYVEKVNIEQGRFDFELFAGILSVITAVISRKIPISPDFVNPVQICLEKWLTQFSNSNLFNFSVCKAVGCALYFFVLLYKHQGVHKQDLQFLNKMRPLVGGYLSSLNFEKMVASLPKFSQILNSFTVDRDPENLPSLGSIALNGSGYLKLVQDESPVPIFFPLCEFLLTIANISSEFEVFLPVVTEKLEKYCKEILSIKANSSWFGRYEVSLLISYFKILSRGTTATDFGVKLVSLLRTDDARVLTILDLLKSSEYFSPVSGIYSVYLRKDFREVSLHSCENFPPHWLYEPVASAPTLILPFLTNILKCHPQLLSHIPVTFRFCHLCLVLLNADNVFNEDVSDSLESCLEDVLNIFEEIDLNSVSLSDKPFYELYRDLVTEYASSSYGNVLFAKVVTLPLAQKFDVSYRKLLWSEFMHALRVITLPKDLVGFVPLDVFTSPVETDESLLVLYLNAVSKNVLMEKRNGFIYQVAVENLRKFLRLPEKDEKLAEFLRVRISGIRDEVLKGRLLGDS